MATSGKSQCLDIYMSDQVLVPPFCHLLGVFECIPASPVNALMAGLLVIQSGFLSLSSGRGSLLCINKLSPMTRHVSLWLQPNTFFFFYMQNWTAPTERKKKNKRQLGAHLGYELKICHSSTSTMWVSHIPLACSNTSAIRCSELLFSGLLAGKKHL